MVEPSDFWDFYHGSKVGRLNRSPFRRVFIQPQVSSRTQVILEIRIQEAAQRRLVQHHEVVEAFASDRPDQALHVGTLPRRSRRGERLANAQVLDRCPEGVTINRIAITQPIARRAIPGERLSDLTRCPFSRRVCCDVEMEETAPISRSLQA